MFKLEELIQI